ncbi:hypothetical protein M9458_004269, partial [Cirrhinus mrigala]
MNFIMCHSIDQQGSRLPSGQMEQLADLDFATDTAYDDGPGAGVSEDQALIQWFYNQDLARWLCPRMSTCNHQPPENRGGQSISVVLGDGDEDHAIVYRIGKATM